MGFWSDMWDGVKSFFKTIGRFLVKIWVAIVDFFGDVVNWFKNLFLVQDRDVPFIIANDKLKEMIHDAPVEDVGIFKGVLNEETGQITHHEVINAEDLDETTEKMLEKANEKDGILVLN